MASNCYQSGIWFVNDDGKWDFEKNNGVTELKCPGEKTTVTFGDSMDSMNEEDFCSPMTCEDSSATAIASTLMATFTAAFMVL